MIFLKICAGLVLLALLILTFAWLVNKIRGFFRGLIDFYRETQTVKDLRINEFDLHKASLEDVVRLVKTRTDEERTLLLFRLYRHLLSQRVDASMLQIFDPANLSNHSNVRVLVTELNELRVAMGKTSVLYVRVPVPVPFDMVDTARLVNRGEKYVEKRKHWLEEESVRRRQQICGNLT